MHAISRKTGGVVAGLVLAAVLLPPLDAGAATIVIRPGAMGSWSVERLHCEGGTPTGSTNFLDGPGAPPLGSGSVNFKVGTDGDSAEVLRNPSYAGVRLNQLTALTFATFVVANTGGQSAYLSIDVDLDGNLTTMEDRLIFEPYYQGPPTHNPALPNQGSLVIGAWQTWNALIGGWWSTDASDDVSPGTGVKSLAHYLSLPGKADARIMNAVPAGGFKIAAGCGNPSWNNFIGAADALTIATSAFSDTFDFERILGPFITSPPDGSIVSPSFAVSGTGPAHQGVRLKDGGVEIARGSINGSGSWSIQLNGRSGTLALRAFATDANNNDSAPSNLVNVTVDASVPAQPVILVPSEGEIVRTNSVTISGTAPAGLKVEVRRSSPGPLIVLGSDVVDPSGAWGIGVSLADGAYTVQAVAINGVGTGSIPAVRNFSVRTDFSPPATPVIRAPAENSLHPGLMTISGDGELGSTIAVREDLVPVGTALVKANGTWSMQVVMRTGGHTVVAFASDEDGNVSPGSNAVTFEVDADPPSISMATGDLSLSVGPAEVRGSASDNRAVTRVEIEVLDLLGGQVFLGDATLGSPDGLTTPWTSQPSTGTGIFTVRATAIDPVGNRSPRASIRIIVIGG